MHLALVGEVGIAGFYVSREVNQAFDSPAAQWGQAAIGFIVTMLCLALALPDRHGDRQRRSSRPKRRAISGGVMGTGPATPHPLPPSSTSTG